MSRCFIFGAAPVLRVAVMPNKDDYIIAADGGLDTLNSLGLAADLILGDFDSLSFTPQGDNVITHPVEKDCTDMQLALEQGYSEGFREFYIYGGVGGDRLDHFVANLQLLSLFADKGADCFLFGEGYVITCLCNGECAFSDKAEGTVSVFCACDKAEGVTIKNLKYTLQDSTLSNLTPLGVSNSFIGKEGKISVKKGILMLVFDEKNLEHFNFYKA